MVTPNDIRVEEHEMIWLDEKYPDKTFYGHIAFIESPEQAVALDNGIKNDDPDWCDFDNTIMYYLYAYLGEQIEDLYPENSLTDFAVTYSKEEV